MTPGDLLIFMELNTAIVCGAALVIFAFYRGLRPVSRNDLAPQSLPFVSVIVPARNEEGKVGRCLESLINQDYPRYEIVVIDDCSNDGTAAIISSYAQRYPIVKHFPGKNNPDGWTGKCNAVVQALAAANGDWLLFTDADTFHFPNSIKDAVGFALSNRADLVSFVPVQELGSFWERVVMPALIGAFFAGDPFHRVNNQRCERAYAYGQYILAASKSYHAIGGHRAVAGEILEDHALARMLKQRGRVVLTADGKTLYHVRMYTNLKTLRHGWIKNLYAIIGCNPLYLLLSLITLNCVLLAPFVTMPAVIFLPDIDVAVLPISILCLIQLALLYLCFQRTRDHLSGVEWYHFSLVPLGSLMVSLLFLASAFNVVTGTRMDWKGRRYKVTAAMTIK